ncbi:glycosyl transferase family 2 [Dictyobacter sp. S3.2.2.5]|uniref:Glycosyl transferase family 2 n=1 Tax=Dictyobacter halimunensis TaxID=3026934 RepID=A0ABQ6G1W2_9CHLR|nr:glycosyl transferase family 2 [Dictyobacter sp. S3.2.2.5]
MSTTCDVTVIICAYTLKRWDDLVAAVESLYRQTCEPDEIIVVVDHNTELFERLRQKYPEIMVIENSHARGLSGARNTGVEIARGAHIAFLDDDAEAESHWIELLLKGCADPNVLGVGGTVRPSWQGPQPVWFPSEFYWVIGCTYQTLRQNPAIVRNPYGGCTCIKHEVFQAIGGFREGIGRVGINFMGGEETELSIRAAQHWPEKFFLLEAKALIFHHIPVERTRLRYFLSRCYAEGLSKALVSRYVGAKDGLSAERSYAAITLPLAMLKYAGQALKHGDPGGFLRAGAIVLGLTMTAIGYIKGRLRSQAATHVKA